jgi:hypothetical protein
MKPLICSSLLGLLSVQVGAVGAHLIVAAREWGAGGRSARKEAVGQGGTMEGLLSHCHVSASRVLQPRLRRLHQAQRAQRRTWTQTPRKIKQHTIGHPNEALSMLRRQIL